MVFFCIFAPWKEEYSTTKTISLTSSAHLMSEHREKSRMSLMY